MPELTLVHFGLFALMLVLGIIGGWILRADRCAKEKIAVSASWQDQLESQQSEHNRLAEQNKSLMEQISQYQASHKDYSNRAKELSDSLKEAFARRDELQRQVKDMRGNLEVAIAQRNRLQATLQNKNVQGQATVIKEKDDKIFRLSRELTTWQSRVPPLVERFQERDKKARELEIELELANERLKLLEDMVKSDHTRIEPVDAESLPDGGDASNEPNAMTSSHSASGIQDQIEERIFDEDEVVDAAISGEANQEETAFAAVFSDDDEMDDDAFDSALFTSDDPDAGVSNESDFEDDVVAEVESDQLLADDSGLFDDEDLVEESADEESVIEIASEPAEQVDDTDDLKSIKGIGPSIEKTLIELGITRFHQIAEMSEYDIDRVAQQLKGFRSRIYREDWIGQARDLHAQKYGDPS